MTDRNCEHAERLWTKLPCWEAMYNVSPPATSGLSDPSQIRITAQGQEAARKYLSTVYELNNVHRCPIICPVKTFEGHDHADDPCSSSLTLALHAFSSDPLTVQVTTPNGTYQQQGRYRTIATIQTHPNSDDSWPAAVVSSSRGTARKPRPVDGHFMSEGSFVQEEALRFQLFSRSSISSRVPCRVSDTYCKLWCSVHSAAPLGTIQGSLLEHPPSWSGEMRLTNATMHIRVGSFLLEDLDGSVTGCTSTPESRCDVGGSRATAPDSVHQAEMTCVWPEQGDWLPMMTA